MPGRAAVHALEEMVVQAATGALAVVVMTATAPDDKPAGATHMVSPFLFLSLSHYTAGIGLISHNALRCLLLYIDSFSADYFGNIK